VRAEAPPVKLFLVGQQTNCDVAKTLSVLQLLDSLCMEMLCAALFSPIGIAAITLDDSGNAVAKIP